jgi:ubiquinone/menaquinone biosynthesis C-methylase UbiE
MERNMRVLDLGCGLGFPLLEIAQRLGSSSRVYGIDPWERALERIRLKTRVLDIDNVELVQGFGENMPFDDDFFDSIVSNNGINNVKDMTQTISECHRVCRSGGQMAVTLNLEETMIEFYTVLRECLEEHSLHEAVERVHEHIYSKRKPLNEVTAVLDDAGFEIRDVIEDEFILRFIDGTTMLNHYLIRYWFMDSWKNIPDARDLEQIFTVVEDKLNERALQKGEVDLSIPFVLIDCRKR